MTTIRKDGASSVTTPQIYLVRTQIFAPPPPAPPALEMASPYDKKDSREKVWIRVVKKWLRLDPQLLAVFFIWHQSVLYKSSLVY